MADPPVFFVSFFPEVPSFNYMFMLEAMTYKASIKVESKSSINPSEIIVQAWTSQCDRGNPTGDWHGLDLKYIGPDLNNDSVYNYGQSEIITSCKDFEFTFRLWYPGLEKDEWVWSHDYGCNGFGQVHPPRDGDQWTLGPDYTHILDSLHLGNFLAATHAKECGFTHVLNVADNLDMVYPEGDVQYYKVPMTDGAHNPIPEHKILEALDWLLKNNKPGNKMLVNCRAGIGRAGSMAVAFVFAQKSEMSFQDAYEFCYAKRFIYPHVGLKNILYKYFPR